MSCDEMCPQVTLLVAQTGCSEGCSLLHTSFADDLLRTVSGDLHAAKPSNTAVCGVLAAWKLAATYLIRAWGPAVLGRHLPLIDCPVQHHGPHWIRCDIHSVCL